MGSASRWTSRPLPTGARRVLISTRLCEVAGELTIRDTPGACPLEATVRGTTLGSDGNSRIGLGATTKLSRADFNLTTATLEESGETGAVGIDVQVSSCLSSVGIGRKVKADADPVMDLSGYQ